MGGDESLQSTKYIIQCASQWPLVIYSKRGTHVKKQKL